MAGEIVSSTTASDQRKFLAARLLQRSYLNLVAASICDKVTMPEGSGLTANFVRYKRMNVPLVPLTEGTDPANSSFTLDTATVTLDQWGDVITVTDRAIKTTAHPLIQQCLDLLADNAARVMDREVQVVWMAGTNVQYGSGSVTTRATVTTAMKLDDATIHKAVVTLEDAGAPPRNAPNMVDAEQKAASGSSPGGAYVGVCGPHVSHDIMATGSSLGTFAAVAMYANQKALYNCEIGTWLGVRWVRTNFIPKFSMLGSTTAAVASGNAFGTDTPVVTAVNGGGTLISGATYFYTVVKKDKTRGFAESISVAHSTAAAATGDNESFTFNFSGLTAGYVYDLYFDKTAAGGTSADSNLGLVQANIEVGTTVTVTAAATSSTTAPANVNTTGTPVIHPVYIHGEASCALVALQQLKVLISKDEATTANPLNLRKTIGWKFMSKAVIKNQAFMLRLEVASAY